MMRNLTIAWLTAGLAAAVTAFAPLAHATNCRGRIGAETAVTGKTAYNPFSPANVADPYRIGITNTGAEPCGYALVFRSRTAQPKLGGTLVYNLTDLGNPALLTNAPPAMAPAARLRAPLAPSATAQIEYQLLIPRGQYAPAATTLRDTLDLELYALDKSERPSAPALQTTTLSISYAVAQVLSVNIKGADSATTVNFGALAKGQQRTVAIQARSNLGYRLDVSSDNRGALAPTPKLPGQTWTVPYAATLGGRSLDFASGANLFDFPPTRPESDATHPLTVTIGDVGQRRAGRYEDVISVEIRAGAP